MTKRFWQAAGLVAVMMHASGAGVRGQEAGPQGNPSGDAGQYANSYDVARAEKLKAREADWRNGAIVYQVFVDRFAPPADPQKKKDLYAAPRRLRDWHEEPTPGRFVESAGVWQHELDFWGGDLPSLRGKLDYIQGLGVDVLYLNPIHKALTNHKYDAQDYFEISPEYGTREDLQALAADLHARGMKLVLDGVFNHMGRTADWFQQGLTDPASPYRSFFYFGDEYPAGYRAWCNVLNLPELNLENPAVRARIYGDADSVVQSFLRDGVDGWRLDVAPELGFKYLAELTEAAHKSRPGSLVIGENWLYPEEWSPSLDAVMNLYYWKVIQHLADGRISGPHAGRLIERMIDDAGLEAILKSWIILDNHDLPRLRTQLPQAWERRIAQVLQMTLPGSPCVYYGVEVGLEGGHDPAQRGPMRWDLVSEDNPEFAWMKQLLDLRSQHRALRIGDFRLLDSERLLAFMRRTDRVAETVVVLVNPTALTVNDVVPLRESKLMNWQLLEDAFSDRQYRIDCGTLNAEVPGRTVCVLRPVIPASGYNPYKRVQ
jgi:glycosidase